MKTAKEIEREFTQKGVKRGDLLLLPAPEALEMIAEFRRFGLRVLGIDGFNLTEETTQPLMEHSLDLSKSSILDVGGGSKFDTWKAASEFIAARLDRDLFFEVTIE